MKRLCLILVLAATLIPGLPQNAGASFIGPYDPINWTTTLTGTPPGGGGSVNTAGAPSSIMLLGGNSGCSTEGTVECTLAFTIHAPGSGLVTFHWAYLTTDVDGPGFDRFFRTSNGTLTQLSDNGGPNSQSGNDSFSVVAGNIFGFVIDCTDCIFGPANVTISEFDGPGPSAVAEPGTLLLLGTSLAGIGTAWRRRRRT